MTKVQSTPNGLLVYFNALQKPVSSSEYIGSDIFLTRALIPVSGSENTFTHVGWIASDISKYPPEYVDLTLDTVWNLLSDIKTELDESISEHFITEDFYIWPVGTYLLDIWAWFDKSFSVGLGSRKFN